MLGAIIGDTCGSIYEFDNCKDYNKIMFFAKGCYPTDDSIMTIAVAKALMDNYGKSKTEIKEALIDTMHLYGEKFPDAGYGGTFGNWLYYKDRVPYNSWGNGSAMRVSSVGWLYDTLEETMDMAKLTAEVTHNHPEGIKGAQATALAIYMARTGHSKDEIRHELDARFGYDLDFTIEEKRPSYVFDVSCMGTMPVALVAFLESNDYEDDIRLALSVGGDSDTIGSITGGIAEAFYGIPDNMKKAEMEILKIEDDPLTPMLTPVVEQFYSFINQRNR